LRRSRKVPRRAGGDRVHSPKFDTEKETPALAAAVARHGIAHRSTTPTSPSGGRTARAWPTVVLVDPQGYVLAQQAGGSRPS
jgi:hypothetical protein